MEIFLLAWGNHVVRRAGYFGEAAHLALVIDYRLKRLYLSHISLRVWTAAAPVACLGAGRRRAFFLRGAAFAFFAVIRGVEARALKDYAGPGANQALGLTAASRAPLQVLVGNLLKGLKAFSAMRAFVFVSRHLSKSPLYFVAETLPINCLAAGAGKIFHRLALLGS